jgi:hypothetical protein
LTKNITVLKKNKTPDGWSFVVEVDGGSKTSHETLLKESVWAELKGEREKPEKLIIDSFKFLLERESNQSILKKFDLELIGEYFPEFKEEILK